MEDDGSVLVRMGDKPRGVIWASQIASGQDNGLRIRVYGEEGALEWYQEDPNTLLVSGSDKPTEIVRTATNGTGHGSRQNTRLPAGHPEGFLEAFANLYSEFADSVSCFNDESPSNSNYDYPTVIDGSRGVAFVETVVDSSNSERKWIEMP
jgi:predicted dehydrogenase